MFSFENVFLVLLFLNWVSWLNGLSCSYIENQSLFSHIICKYFLPFSRISLFTLSVTSFPVQEPLSLITSYVFIFYFISFTLGDRIKKKILLWFMSKSLLPIFSYRDVIICNHTCRSLGPIQFEFIFVHMLDNILISFFYM